MIGDLAIAETRKEIEHFCGLGSRVIDQSRRGVLDGEASSNCREALFDFEPTPTSSNAAKVQTPIEFGHKIFLAESAHGLITRYDVLDGNPVDEQHVSLRWNATGRPSATSPNCMDRIAASSVRRT